MWKHLQSASKLVLLIPILTACVLVSYIVWKNSDNEKITIPLVTAFVMIIQSIVSSYFQQKGQNPQPGSVTVTPNESPAAVSTTVSTTSDSSPSA